MAEKKINEVAPFARERFEKGVAAYNKGNYDYAVELFMDVLNIDPALFEARKYLRASQHKRLGEKKGLFKSVIGRASSSGTLAKAQMLARRNPTEAMQLAEKVLNGDPENLSAHRVIADAASILELRETAVLSLEIIFKRLPNDTKITLQLADAYADAGRIAKAMSLYEDVVKANPNNAELHQALKDLSARQSLAEGGYGALEGGSGSFRDVLKDVEGAGSLEAEGRLVKSAEVSGRLIAEQERRLEADPENMQIVRTLAELCMQANDFGRALQYYAKLKQSDAGMDPSLDQAITTARLRWFDQRLANAADEDERAGIARERREFELEDAMERAKRYPSDLPLRFDLGRLYFEAGKLKEAIQEFQKAQNNPQRRVQSLGYLAQCFSRRGMNDVAIRTVERALEDKQGFDGEKKELLYLLGTFHEATGHMERAIEPYKQIYEVDIGFKDVADKVDAYYED